MHIDVLSIEQLNDQRLLATIRLDSDTVFARITESADPVHSFNFDQEFFDILFNFDGLGFRFNHDYFRFRNGNHPPFPWDYGDHDREILDYALQKSHTQMSSLRTPT